MSMPCKGSGQQTNRAHHRGPTTNPVVHRERCSQPSFTASLSRSLSLPVTATNCGAKGTPNFWKRACVSSMPLRVSLVPPDFEVTTTSVCFKPFAEPGEHAVEAVRVGVIEKVGYQPVVGRAQRIRHQLRPQRRSADAHHQHVLERLAARRLDLAAVHCRSRTP